MSACSIIFVISALSPALSFISLSSRAEKLQDDRIELARFLDVRDVSALIDHDQCRPRNVLVKTLAVAQRQETVFTSPHDQCRLLDLRHHVIEKIFTANDRLGKTLDREAVAGS